MLGDLHGHTWADPSIAARFDDDEAFGQLRVHPFYEVTAAAQPAVAGRIAECAAQLRGTHDCLVHGDYSPKNVLVGADGLMLLDFEVAHVGASVFDVAFMSSHLALKVFHRPALATAFTSAGRAFVAGYVEHVGALVQGAVRGATAGANPGATLGANPGATPRANRKTEAPDAPLRLLGAHTACLMLARVDGLSPAPYLSDDARATVRRCALDLLIRPDVDIEDVWQAVGEHVGVA
jgi:hypothetical protein